MHYWCTQHTDSPEADQVAGELAVCEGADVDARGEHGRVQVLQQRTLLLSVHTWA